MKIYTKTGDSGETSFFGEGRVEKNDPRIEALGALDELNSIIGVTLCFIQDEKLKNTLSKIQNDLFTLGADVAGSAVAREKLPRITPEHVQEMEQMIDELEEKLGMPKKFILPGGTQASSFLHLCRAVVRRTERSLVATKHLLNYHEQILCYINRLGDFFYVLARQANKEQEIKEQQPMYKYLERKESLEEKEESGEEKKLNI